MVTADEKLTAGVDSRPCNQFSFVERNVARADLSTVDGQADSETVRAFSVARDAADPDLVLRGRTVRGIYNS